MTVNKAYFSGLKFVRQYLPMYGVMFTLSLILGVTLVLPAQVGLRTHIAGIGLSFSDIISLPGFVKSLEATQTASLIDLTVVAGWMGVVFFLLNSFLRGGVLTAIQKEAYTSKSFFSGAAQYFFRNLQVGILTALLQAVFTSGFVFGINQLSDNKSITPENYTILFYTTLGVLLISLWIVRTISDYTLARVIMRNSKSVLHEMGKSASFVFRHFFPTMSLHLLLLAAPVLLLSSTLLIARNLDPGLALNKAVLVTMGLIVLFGREFFRVWRLDSQYDFYLSDLFDGYNVKKGEVGRWVENANVKEQELARERQKKQEEEHFALVQQNTERVGQRLSVLQSKLSVLEQLTEKTLDERKSERIEAELIQRRLEERQKELNNRKTEEANAQEGISLLHRRAESNTTPEYNREAPDTDKLLQIEPQEGEELFELDL